jgi:hypothetical protein
MEESEGLHGRDRERAPSAGLDLFKTECWHDRNQVSLASRILIGRQADAFNEERESFPLIKETFKPVGVAAGLLMKNLARWLETNRASADLRSGGS